MLSLPIVNFTVDQKKFKRHSELFGGDCKRGLIVGPSGSGKTNVMLTLLLSSNGLRFFNVYLCSQSSYQPKYIFLRETLEDISGCCFYSFSDPETFVVPSDVREYSIVIFDDVSSESHSVIKDFFAYGRHKNVDCFYLCQSYSSIPKQLIRDNCNLLVLFKQDLRNLKHIYDDHLVGDITFEDFKTICRNCWNNPHDILVIDLDCPHDNGKFRQGFDKFINI